MATFTAPPVRTHEISGAMKTMLSTARMTALLYAASRVYAERERPTKPEAAKNVAWGRVIVQLADYGYPRVRRSTGSETGVSVLVIAEVNQPTPDFDYTQALEAIHEEAHAQLDGQTLTLTKATVLYKPVFLGYVNERPVRDEENGVWVQTARYVVCLKSP